MTGKGSLQKHVKSIHNGVKFSCEYCDYNAIEKGSIRKYIKSIHDGVVSHCDVWGKDYSSKDFLEDMEEVFMKVFLSYCDG